MSKLYPKVQMLITRQQVLLIMNKWSSFNLIWVLCTEKNHKTNEYHQIIRLQTISSTLILHENY